MKSENRELLFKKKNKNANYCRKVLRVIITETEKCFIFPSPFHTCRSVSVCSTLAVCEPFEVRQLFLK